MFEMLGNYSLSPRAFNRATAKSNHQQTVSMWASKLMQIDQRTIMRDNFSWKKFKSFFRVMRRDPRSKKFDNKGPLCGWPKRWELFCISVWVGISTFGQKKFLFVRRDWKQQNKDGMKEAMKVALKPRRKQNCTLQRCSFISKDKLLIDSIASVVGEDCKDNYKDAQLT